MKRWETFFATREVVSNGNGRMDKSETMELGVWDRVNKVSKVLVGGGWSHVTTVAYGLWCSPQLPYSQRGKARCP